MRKHIGVFVLFVLVLAIPLCMAACGGSKGSGGKDNAVTVTYEVLDPVPTSSITNPGSTVAYSVAFSSDGKVTWTKTRVYTDGQALKAGTSEVIVGRYTDAETAIGTYEVTAEGTYLVSRTGYSRKIVFDNEADRQTYIEYIDEYGSLNKDDIIAACSEKGRSYTADEMKSKGLTGLFNEIKPLEDGEKALVIKEYQSGKVNKTYFYDSENRTTKIESQNGADEYHYDENGVLTGETSWYTIVVGGVTKLKTTEYSIIDGKLHPTHHTETEDGVLTVDEYYD